MLITLCSCNINDLSEFEHRPEIPVIDFSNPCILQCRCGENIVNFSVSFHDNGSAHFVSCDSVPEAITGASFDITDESVCFCFDGFRYETSVSRLPVPFLPLEFCRFVHKFNNGQVSFIYNKNDDCFLAEETAGKETLKIIMKLSQNGNPVFLAEI